MVLPCARQVDRFNAHPFVQFHAHLDLPQLIFLLPWKTPEYLLKHQECVLLNRVLSDKTKLPPACFAPPSTRAVRRVTTRRKAPKPAPRDESAIGGVVRRITGAVQPVLNSLNAPNPPKKGVWSEYGVHTR